MTRPQKTPRETSPSNVNEQGDLPSTAASTWHLRPSHLRAANPSAPERETDDPLDEGLEETFPGSDPVSATRRMPG